MPIAGGEKSAPRELHHWVTVVGAYARYARGDGYRHQRRVTNELFYYYRPEL